MRYLLVCLSSMQYAFNISMCPVSCKSVVDMPWRHPFDPLLVACTQNGSLPGTQRRKRCEFGAPSEKAVFGSELVKWSVISCQWKVSERWVYIDKPALKKKPCVRQPILLIFYFVYKLTKVQSARWRRMWMTIQAPVKIWQRISQANAAIHFAQA